MIVNGYLVKILEREVRDDNGNPRVVYSAYVIDDDDVQGGSPLKITLNNLSEAQQLKALERHDVSLVCYINLWSYEGRRGVSFKYVGPAGAQK